jgi:hypothetical protein
MSLQKVIKKFEQQTDEKLDYDFVFNLPSTDSVSSVQIPVNPSGLTVSSTSMSANTVKVWLTGGTDGADYTVTVKATTSEGRVKELAMILRVRNDY